MSITVTVTAKPYLGPGKFSNSQFEIRRFTVIEHDKQPVDNTTPICNVTKVTGTCDTGNELCKCNEKVWSMWVDIGDEGFGLQDIVTTGVGPNSSFRHDPFKPGHTIQDGKITAEISDDCCHQKATVTIVDKAGNTAQCKNNLNPNFVPPDPKTCLGNERRHMGVLGRVPESGTLKYLQHIHIKCRSQCIDKT
ncbi:hypothetical protein CHS0354_022083 [Potamilus streckersoni]|uniref:Uncharacterized protein n=1 Tax=Potamilus streckersoni TaxID=2493646 RepID=A0AAE0W0M2_9BIVA|nr:hypothetical protein CHS0354_022083 [Potamilus streckersoni]